MTAVAQKSVIESFSEPRVLRYYTRLAREGLWDNEVYAIKKFFVRKGSVLDLGCGTGRTTFPLHLLGFKVTGLDITPMMVDSARKLARRKHARIPFIVGDACSLPFSDSSFDYALFSNQGWTQIPSKDLRAKALSETYRVLKKRGIFVLTAHPRRWRGKWPFFWMWQWIRFYLLRPFCWEESFGDRRFSYKSIMGADVKQYIHIPSVNEVVSVLTKAGFEVIEVRQDLQMGKKRKRKHPPVVYVAKKK